MADKKEFETDEDPHEYEKYFTGLLDVNGHPIYKYVERARKPPVGFGRDDEW